MKNNNLKFNQIRCVASIVISLLIVILTFIGMLIRFFYFEGTTNDAAGISSFKFFTLLSNVVCSFCAMLSIPYAIDGLRTKNYHLPRWIVDVLYIGVTCVSMTFLISICLLSSFAGFTKVMFYSTNVIFHTICPILAILLFLFLDSYHNIKFYKTFIALTPIVIYLTIYIVLVFGLEIWTDFYKIGVYMPWVVSFILALVIAFLIALCLRIGHNAIHKHQKNNFISYYLNDFKCNNMHEALYVLAKENNDDAKGDMNIPRRKISILMKRFKADDNIEIYLKEYIDNLYKLNK